MPEFRYKAIDKFSKAIKGVMAAESRDSVSIKLKDMGYIPVSIDQIPEMGQSKMFSFFRRVSLQEVAVFTRQMYSLQKAGVPLLPSLEAITQQTGNKHFEVAIREISNDIKKGASFSDALNKHKNIFDEVYHSAIKAAEASGTIVEILRRLTDLIEGEIDLRQRIKAATRYPMIAFFTLCVGFLIVITFVVPRFASVYAQFNTLLPLPTRMMIAVNGVIQNYWFLVILGVISSIVLFLWFINTRVGRALWDNFKLSFPVFGKLIKLFIMARFARMTAILMRSGVPILDVLTLVGGTSGNVIISRAIDMIKESVNQGKGMSEPMKVSSLFPPLVIQMVVVGEQIGKIDELLLGVADYYDNEASYMVKNLTTYIEPLLIFVLAVMVLIMALGIYMPMWNLINLFRG